MRLTYKPQKTSERDIHAEHKCLLPGIERLVVHITRTVDGSLRVHILGVLLERRPVTQVLAREEDAHGIHIDLACPCFGQRITDGQVLETQVAQVLYIAVVHLAQGAGRGRIGHGTGEVGVSVVLGPDIVQEILRQIGHIRIGIGAPETGQVTGGIPLVLACALEKQGYINAAPACTARDAIIEAGQRITLCRPVSRIIHIVAAYAQPGIAVQAYKFQAVGLPISGLIDFQISPDFFTGLRLRLFRSTEKPIGNAPPYFSQSHGVVIVFGRSHV